MVLPGGDVVQARVAGRDRGTNVVAFLLDRAASIAAPKPAEPEFGGLALVFAGVAGVSVRLATISMVGPEWLSLAGGRIDRRIVLDRTLRRSEEGGPVLDAKGGLLGMATAGPRREALVIPAATIDRVLEPLLTAGRVDRGWLGVALHPVALPPAAASSVGQDRGLMVMQVHGDGPAAKAGVLAGDILVAIAGTPALNPREIARRLGSESLWAADRAAPHARRRLDRLDRDGYAAPGGMSEPPVPHRPLRVALAAADPSRRALLAEIVGRAGHQIVAAADDADVILADATGAVPEGVPVVSLGDVEAGQMGLLSGNATPEQIVAALAAVAAGLIVRGPFPPDHGFAAFADDGTALLTPRETEVLAAIGRGCSNKQAARELGISQHTVKFHVESLLRKLGAASRAEAVHKGLRQRLIEM